MLSQMLENLIENVKVKGLEFAFRRYYSLYRAQVTDNKDKDKRGRIKVIVPAIFDGEELAEWVEPKDFMARNGSGLFNPPEIDDWVFVEFEGGDLQHPVYSGGWYGEKELADDFVHEKDEPVVRGFITNSGHKVLFDEREGKESITVASKANAQAVFSKDGDITLFNNKGGYVTLSGKNGEISAVNHTGALISIKDDVVISSKTAKSVVSVGEKSVQITTSLDAIVQSNTATIKTGAFTLDTGLAKMTAGNGKVAIGTPAAEVIDQTIQFLDTFITAAVVTTCGVGPTSGFSPAIVLKLNAIKAKLMTIKS